MKPKFLALLLLSSLSLNADTASWYGKSHRGLTMANGKPFDPDALTCASWFHPLGTKLLLNGSVIVTVTDRGPAKRLLKTRQIDLSRAAFKRLAPLRRGLTKVAIQPAK